jgi:hypothetical protein
MSSNSDFVAHCRTVIAKARSRGLEPQVINELLAALHAFESGQGGLDKLRQLTKRLNKRAQFSQLPPQENPMPRKNTGVQIVQGGAPG